MGYNNVHGFYIQVSRGQSHLSTISLYSSPNLKKCRTLYYSRTQST
ncbi:hypothetical protein P4S72_12195 [Vibrio sp. PP-XX7]